MEEASNLQVYKNSEFTIDERVSDLLSRMTIMEKVRQLDQYMGTTFVNKAHPMQFTVMDRNAEFDWEKIEELIGQAGAGCIHDLYGNAEATNKLQKYFVEKTRLGIPVLFSEKALHGLLKPGCTVFPHAITQAATFDEKVPFEIGRGIAAETRSYGICETFGPVLDLAREPRWGRMEENYGEDTYLAGCMGTAMVKGLQGDDVSCPDSIIAEPKHFAVHGIPEGGLNMSHTSIGRHEMESYFLPVFEAAFAYGGAINAMCSYNAIDGQPCSSSYDLLTEVLRGRWGMRGFVRSDLGAIARLYKKHRTAASEKEAIKQALEGGTDMQYYDFPHEVYQTALIQMVEEGEISLATLDQAVSRVLLVKFMLGLFDHPYTDEKLSEKVVRCEKHRQVALTAGREGICLLKNKDNILPLSKAIASIAVIGPSANEIRLGDYTPFIEGFKPITVLQGIRDLVSKHTVVKYSKGTGILENELEFIPEECLINKEEPHGLFGEYYDNPELSGAPVFTRIDPQINFNWIIGKPDERLPEREFSVRWEGKIVPKISCNGKLGIITQDSMKLFIDGELIIDNWKKDELKKSSVPFSFEAGREYDIKVEYCKDKNGAQVVVAWDLEEKGFYEAIKIAAESQVAIVALGDSERTCGENIDRMELGLPGRQLELLKAIKKTGTPVILVLQNGRAMTLEWEAENMDGIIEAWYGGEKGGKAIAEVIFGDYNPAGRLPVSFPRNIGQLPVYYSKRRGGNDTYIEGNNKPLYPFGYGLSYTSFKYENLKLTSTEMSSQETITATFELTNVGDRDGDEVVQLYISDLYSSVVRPEKELKGLKRIHLRAGEKVQVNFDIKEDILKLLNKDFKWVVEPGTFKLMIGPSSDKEELYSEFNVI